MRILLLILSLLLTAPVSADVYIIANRQLPQNTISKADVTSLYFGKTNRLATGEAVELLDLGRSEPPGLRLYTVLSGLGRNEIAIYWAKLRFSGRVTPPRSFSSESELTAYVGRNPGAIGVVFAPASDQRVKLLLHLPE